MIENHKICRRKFYLWLVSDVVYKMETEWKEEAILKLIELIMMMMMMMMMMSGLYSASYIVLRRELYQKHPIGLLYDPSNHNYRNKEMKKHKELENVHILDRNGE